MMECNYGGPRYTLNEIINANLINATQANCQIYFQPLLLAVHVHVYVPHKHLGSLVTVCRHTSVHSMCSLVRVMCSLLHHVLSQVCDHMITHQWPDPPPTSDDTHTLPVWGVQS